MSCSSQKKDNSWGIFPDEIKKLREREFKRIDRKKGEIEGDFTFYMESKKDLQIDGNDNFFSVKSTINQSQFIECLVSKKQNLISKNLLSVTNSFIDESKKFEFLKSRSGLFDNRPYLSLHTQFLNQNGEIKLLKVITVRDSRRQITCFNEDMGFEKSFRRVVMDFISSIQDRQSKKNKFEQVSFISQGKSKFGYSRDTLSQKVGGGDLLKTTSHSIIIKKPTVINAVDEIILQSIGENLEFKELYIERYLNGEKVKRVFVRPEGLGAYLINMQLNGSEIEAIYPLTNMTSNLLFEYLVYQKLTKMNQFKELTFWATYNYPRPVMSHFIFQKVVKGKKYIRVKFENSSEIWRYDESGNVDLKIIRNQGNRFIKKRAYRYGDL